MNAVFWVLVAPILFYSSALASAEKLLRIYHDADFSINQSSVKKGPLYILESIERL